MREPKNIINTQHYHVFCNKKTLEHSSKLYFLNGKLEISRVRIRDCQLTFSFDQVCIENDEGGGGLFLSARASGLT